MAPEFFGCLLFAVLTLATLGLGVAVIAFKRLRSGLLPIFLLVLIADMLLGYQLRQAYGLDEPLAGACARGDLEKVRLLLRRGGSPDALGVDCAETALTNAARSGHVEIVRLLLEKGADVNLRNSRGRTPLSVAREAGHAGVAEILERAGGRE